MTTKINLDKYLEWRKDVYSFFIGLLYRDDSLNTPLKIYAVLVCWITIELDRIEILLFMDVRYQENTSNRIDKYPTCDDDNF